MPADLALIGVDGVLPGDQFRVEDVEVLDAPVEALAGQGGELDLCDVEPRAVLGSVMDLEPLGQREGGISGSNASYSEAMSWVLRLSITSTTRPAPG